MILTLLAIFVDVIFLNQARLVSWNCFCLQMSVCLCVCVFVCVSALEAINN